MDFALAALQSEHAHTAGIIQDMCSWEGDLTRTPYVWYIYTEMVGELGLGGMCYINTEVADGLGLAR